MIKGLRDMGWNETPPAADEEALEGDLAEFWTALDPRYKDGKPKPASPGWKLVDEIDQAKERPRQNRGD